MVTDQDFPLPPKGETVLKLVSEILGYYSVLSPIFINCFPRLDDEKYLQEI
jgi:hypothetical protein